ncbi:hypothetical protein J6590_082017 [Homalodisca vitripennis]|nr:hypothetical protein J6590_082017 [Homalodisca vitripennis]
MRLSHMEALADTLRVERVLGVVGGGMELETHDGQRWKSHFHLPLSPPVNIFPNPWSEDKSFLGLLRSGELFQLVLRSDARAAPPDFDLLSDLSHHRWHLRGLGAGDIKDKTRNELLALSLKLVYFFIVDHVSVSLSVYNSQETMCQRDNRDQSSHQHQCLRQTPVSRGTAAIWQHRLSHWTISVRGYLVLLNRSQQLNWKKLENEFAKWCRKRPNVFHFLAGKSVVQHQQSLKLDLNVARCIFVGIVVNEAYYDGLWQFRSSYSAGHPPLSCTTGAYMEASQSEVHRFSEHLISLTQSDKETARLFKTPLIFVFLLQKESI